MNYLTELKAFHDSILMNGLSTGQIALWYALMYINNKCNWIEWFSVSNQVLSIQTGMSRSGILKARNELKQKGYIEFKSRGTEATLYKVIPMSKSAQDSTQDSTQVGVQVGVQVGAQDSTQVGNTLNKHKQKLKQEKNTKKESKGTRFSNFDERRYDMGSLEKQLLSTE